LAPRRSFVLGKVWSGRSFKGVVTGFNSLIDKNSLVIAGACSLIVRIATDVFGLESEEIAALLEQVILTIHVYRIDSIVDSDGGGVIDEETINGLLDDDSDGSYDKDSNSTWELAG
jgi:hypothetical protein